MAERASMTERWSVSLLNYRLDKRRDETNSDMGQRRISFWPDRGLLDRGHDLWYASMIIRSPTGR